MQPKRSPAGLIISLLMFSLVGFAWLQRQAIYDFTRLRNYQIPLPISQLASETTMNSYARNIFFVQHPELDDKTVFNQHCRSDEQTIVLGCYINKQGIYVLDIADPRLDGVKQVTSAHEMLHAAYDRLSSKDRAKVDMMISSAYQALNDVRIKNTIVEYRKANADINDELHSILGTEVRNLPPDLETYYKKYFTNRLAIVTFSEKYESVFTERKNRVDQYDVQLADLKSRIDAAEADLNQQSDNLNAKRQQLDQELASGRYDLYNASVASFNNSVRSYNNAVSAARNMINQYNQILDARNAIALEEQELYKVIDSRLTTQTAK